ncbi:SDR family NAD(P)-dependent oxidoreductase [Arthrobacter sp. 49Tsu3.1M3]|uniref:SDR family NAD(P)-dependent oxidoreductase n=1 Tax=Arthrobacter sp. 49Tsu3.1M3 TaxID=1279029 RepID=UPI00356920EC
MQAGAEALQGYQVDRRRSPRRRSALPGRCAYERSMGSQRDVLRGRVAVVTGSTRGLGFAMARLQGQRGATVGLASRSGVDVAAAVERLHTEGIAASGRRCDTGELADVEGPPRRGLRPRDAGHLGQQRRCFRCHPGQCSSNRGSQLFQRGADQRICPGLSWFAAQPIQGKTQ